MDAAADVAGNKSVITPAGCEAIHFSKKRAGKPISDMRTFWIGQGLFGGLIVAFLIVGQVIYSVLRSQAVWWVLGFVGAVIVGALIFVAIRESRKQRAIDRRANWRDDVPDESYRVRCIGTPEDIEQYGPIANLPFEPQIGAAWFRPEFRGAMYVVLIGITVIGFAAYIAINIYFAARVNVPQLGFAAAFVAAHAVVGFMWPTYYRVVPGRLDVLRFSPRRKTQCVSHDVRHSRVLIDLRRRYVQIERTGEPVVTIHMRYVPESGRLIYMVLLAAISTSQPGPLPEDELLG